MPDAPNAFAELQGESEAEDASPPPGEMPREVATQPSLHGAFWTLIASMVLVTAFLIGTS